MSEKILEWDVKIQTTKQKQTIKHSIQKIFGYLKFNVQKTCM